MEESSLSYGISKSVMKEKAVLWSVKLCKVWTEHRVLQLQGNSEPAPGENLAHPQRRACGFPHTAVFLGPRSFLGHLGVAHGSQKPWKGCPTVLPGKFLAALGHSEPLPLSQNHLSLRGVSLKCNRRLESGSQN